MTRQIGVFKYLENGKSEGRQIVFFALFTGNTKGLTNKKKRDLMSLDAKILEG